jgi:hypothetical protein
MNKQLIVRGLLLLPGLLMLMNAVSFLVQPEQAAESLGMILLDGVGRSSQIGDMGAFFACTAGFVFYGVARTEPGPIYASAALLISAAVYRIAAWLMHEAEFVTQFIVVEVILFVWLVVLARLMVSTSEVSSNEA